MATQGMQQSIEFLRNTWNSLVLDTVVLEEEERLEGVKQEVSQVLIEVGGQNAAVKAV